MYYENDKLPSGATKKTFTSVGEFVNELKTHKKDVLISGNALGLLTNGSAESKAFLAAFDGADSSEHLAGGFFGVAHGCQLFTDAYASENDSGRVFFGVSPQYMLLNNTFDLPVVVPDTKSFYRKGKVPEAASKVAYTNIDAFLRTIAVHAGDVIIPGLIYQDIVVSSQAQSFFDPIHTYEHVVRGLLGVMLNNRIFTDCFMKPGDTDRIFADNERAFYLVHRDNAVHVPR